MGKTLLTGATGFIGHHIAHELVARGDDLRVTLRATSDPRPLKGLDVEAVRCDVLDRRAVRRALKGVDKVFHAAGVTSVRPDDADRAFATNVEGTRMVFSECLRADVERVVFTSSAATLGPAPFGGAAAETQEFTGAGLEIPYVSSVHEAEAEAFRLAATGLPLVCVNPTVVWGPEDLHVTSTRLVRSFLLGKVPAYVDGAINVVDVRDVAHGHLLADEQGAVGERYILGGRNFTFDRLFADLGRLSGVEPPVKVPRRLAAVAATLQVGPGTLKRHEVAAASQYWTYRSTKAQRELGWKARAHEDTVEATVSWYLEREHDRLVRVRGSQRTQYRVARAALSLGEDAVSVAARMARGIAAGR